MNGAMVGRRMSVLRARRAISSSLSEEKSPASNNKVTEHAKIKFVRLSWRNLKREAHDNAK